MECYGRGIDPIEDDTNDPITISDKNDVLEKDYSFS